MTMRTPGGIAPLATFNGTDIRAQAIRSLRERLGREPTADDIRAEKASRPIVYTKGTLRDNNMRDGARKDTK